MIHQIYSHRFRRLEQVLRSGPVGPFVDEFASLVLAAGFRHKYLRVRFEVVAELNRWLVRKGIGLWELNNRRIAEFVECRSATQRANMCRRGQLRVLALFLELVRSRGAVPREPEVSRAKDPFEEVLSVYSAYLVEQKGLARTTVSRQLVLTRRFLRSLFGRRQVDYSVISAKAIMGFVREYAGNRGAGDSAMMVYSIRSFLRFLVQHGKIDEALAECVPTVPSRRHERVPAHLSGDELKHLLDSCKGTTRVARRNYAVVLLLARLGLRASEVAKLSLDDIDWEHGELMIQGKGNRVSSLPVPKDVGNAIVGYLQHARPWCSSRRLFISTRAPYRPIKNGTVVSSIVARAVKKAGLNPRRSGAHLLRHTLATESLRNGATLSEIGQILRHARIDTTAIYAKVDFLRLVTLAMPWPQVSSDGGAR